MDATPKACSAEQLEAGYKPSFPVVGIGASAGGLEALVGVFKALDPRTGMAFVVIPHQSPDHDSHLPEILARAACLPVIQAADRTAVAPDTAYVVPPNSVMAIADGVLKISERPRQPADARRPIDHFLGSLASDQGHCAIGVILSGMATDGTRGLHEIKANGGITFAQDATALHDEMPRSAIAAGCVDYVLAPPDIARELARIARHPHARSSLDEAADAGDALRPLFDLLRNQKQVNFAHYKRGTWERRILRRMALHRTEGIDAYLKIVQDDPKELDALFQDVLISVTSFFRDPQAFDALQSKVFPRLIADRSGRDPLRIWVAGCSTGEEAYSLAIALAEFGERAGRHVPAQIFATDVNAISIEKARAGVYPASIAKDVSAERRRRFFRAADQQYRIDRAIREMCVFAHHNLLTSPPFSRIDLISCRNVLIYLTGEVQRKVVPLLHRSLNPGGILWLGTAEGVGGHRSLFALHDSKHKVYLRRPAARIGPAAVSPFGFEPLGKELPPRRVPVSAQPLDPQQEADRILLARYAPASVLVNGDFQIIQYRGDTGLYLAPAPGPASLDVFSMLREGLLVAVRAVAFRARREGKAARSGQLLVKLPGGPQLVTVEAVPLPAPDPADTCLLILFENAGPAGATAASRPVRESKSATGSTWRESVRLKQELIATREHLQSLIQQYETANHELQAANEEVQSSNEELQSVNEELQTSREEIQTANEELTTVNEELERRNNELAQVNDDLLNVVTGMQTAVVNVNAALRITRYTSSAEKMLKLGPADIGRPVGGIGLDLNGTDLESVIAQVLQTANGTQIQATDGLGNSCLLQVRPYLTVESKPDGAVLVLTNLDALEAARAAAPVAR